MQIVRRMSELRKLLDGWKAAGEDVALIPTLGALHQGHLSLIEYARKSAPFTAVSIFVNPLQFDDKQDLAKYPRTLQADIKKLMQAGCNLLFTPDNDVMYPQGMDFHSFIHVPGMDDKLCGLERPGHFDGVATVVTKLFNMVQADVAVFGEKDYQQLLIIKRAATDLSMPMQIVGVPTRRETDGLAMSSRNRYLSAEDRQLAPRIYEELERARKAIETGADDLEALEITGLAALKSSGFRPDYFSIRDAQTLEVAGTSKDLVVLTAARIGRARLIDNVRARRPG